MEGGDWLYGGLTSSSVATGQSPASNTKPFCKGALM